MRITTWNCNGAFRKKFKDILNYDSDIYIIQECEDPLKTNNIEYQSWAKNYLWIGNSKNKGLGIFAKENIKLQNLEWQNKFQGYEVKYFLPCRVNNKFNLLGVWNHQNNSPTFEYIGQFWKYLQLNKSLFKDIIIAGDFNSNSQWDEWDRWWNHSDVVNELIELNIYSIYHDWNNEKQGYESIPTLFFQKNLLKPYHIDYIFATEFFFNTTENFEIGKHDSWLKKSDHMPITFDITI